MSILSVPINFQIFKGNQLVREEALKESVIKIGKLASSHLRLDDETVSRMHAVIEVVGPGQVQLIDLGSTRGTMVNGARINKAILNPGDEIHFGSSRVVVAFEHHVSVAEATPPLAAMCGPARATQPATLQPDHVLPMAVPQTTHAVHAEPAGYGNADIELLDGSKAIEVQTLYRGVGIKTRHLTDATGKSPTRQAWAFLAAGALCVLVALAIFFSTMVAAGHERGRYEKLMSEGGEARNFQWTNNSPTLDFAVFGGIALGLLLVYMGLKRRAETSPNFVIGSDAKADAPWHRNSSVLRPFRWCLPPGLIFSST